MAFVPTNSSTYCEATDDELVEQSKGWRNDIVAGFQIEMARRLKGSVDTFNIASAKQADEMIHLTRRIKWLTWAMFFTGCVQAGGTIWLIIGVPK